MASASTFFSATRNTGLDFKTLLESHAYISHLKANKKTADIKRFLLHGTSPEFEHLRFDVSWENARLEFQDPEWTFPVNDVHDSSRKNNETWDFEKSVSNFEVTNEYTDETKAVFKLSWLEGNTFGLDLNTTLELPTEAKEVFGETTVLNINGPSFETHCDQKSKNSVKVPVLANQATTLVTTHRERNFKGTFTSKAFLGGKVSVRISNTKKNELIRTVTDDVIDVFRQMSQEMSHFSNSEKTSFVKSKEPCQVNKGQAVATVMSFQMSDKLDIVCSSSKLKADCEAYVGPFIGMTTGAHGILDGATEFVYCCEILPQERDYSMVSSLRDEI